LSSFLNRRIYIQRKIGENGKNFLGAFIRGVNVSDERLGPYLMNYFFD
jgi:hypothetical protein